MKRGGKRKYSLSLILLVLFNLLYVLGFGVYYVGIQNYEFLVYIGVLVLIGAVVIGTLRYSKLDKFALWGLSIWGFLHMAGGGIRIGASNLYSVRLIDIISGEGQFYILKMDQVIHFYGFFITAIVIYQILRNNFKIGEHTKLAVFLAWIGSMGLGALNEVVEFVAFVSLSQTGVGDVYNTGLDLIFNMCGALVGAFVQRFRS